MSRFLIGFLYTVAAGAALVFAHYLCHWSRVV